MNFDEIEAQQAKLAAAKPFAELEAACAAMSNLTVVLTGFASTVKGVALGHYSNTEPTVWMLRERVLNDYAKCRDRLHAAVDAVMRTAIVDGAKEPEAEPAKLTEDVAEMMQAPRKG